MRGLRGADYFFPWDILITSVCVSPSQPMGTCTLRPEEPLAKSMYIHRVYIPSVAFGGCGSGTCGGHGGAAPAMEGRFIT